MLPMFLVSQTSGAILAALYVPLNLGMGKISWMVTLHQARKTCQGQTLQLIGPFGSYKENKHGAVFTTLCFLLNFLIDPISKSVSLHKVGKACQVQTLQLIGPQVMKKIKCWRGVSLSAANSYEMFFCECLSILKVFVRLSLASRHETRTQTPTIRCSTALATAAGRHSFPQFFLIYVCLCHLNSVGRVNGPYLQNFYLCNLQRSTSKLECLSKKTPSTQSNIFSKG